MSKTRSVTTVLHYYRYLGAESQTVYSHEEFCGECFRHLASPHHFPKYPEDLEAENKETFDSSWHGRGDRELEYYSFCPWCGTAFEDEWWKNQPVQNERAIDHYQDPGTHKDDTHEFRGDSPNCMANHWLGVSGGDKVCWCDPEVEPGIMGCVIRHQDKSYEEYQASQRETAESSEDTDEGQDYDW